MPQSRLRRSSDSVGRYKESGGGGTRLNGHPLYERHRVCKPYGGEPVHKSVDAAVEVAGATVVLAGVTTPLLPLLHAASEP